MIRAAPNRQIFLTTDNREEAFAAMWKLRALGHKRVDCGESRLFTPPIPTKYRYAVVKEKP